MTCLIRKVDYRGVELELFGYMYNGRSRPSHDTVELVDVTIGSTSIYDLFNDDQIEHLRDMLLEEAVDSWAGDASEYADRCREERRAA